MPASRRVNAAHVQAVSHVDNLWRAIAEHVKECPQCKTAPSWTGGTRFISGPTCDWGAALEEELCIALKRLDETNNTARGGPAPSTKEHPT
jgi:hypothetical protein